MSKVTKHLFHIALERFNADEEKANKKYQGLIIRLQYVANRQVVVTQSVFVFPHLGYVSLFGVEVFVKRANCKGRVQNCGLCSAGLHDKTLP